MTAVATVAALVTTLPLLADDRTDLILPAVADTTSTAVVQDGDNSAKTTLATCPAVCDRNPRGWRDAVVSFDVKGIPAGATGITARLRLYSWQAVGAATSERPGEHGRRPAPRPFNGECRQWNFDPPRGGRSRCENA